MTLNRFRVALAALAVAALPGRTAAQEDAKARMAFGEIIPPPPDGWKADRPRFLHTPDGTPAAAVRFRKGSSFVMVRFRILKKPRHVDYAKTVKTDPHLKRAKAEAIMVGKVAALYDRAGRRWRTLGFPTPHVAGAVLVHAPNADGQGRALGIKVIRGIAWDRLATVSISER